MSAEIATERVQCPYLRKSNKEQFVQRVIWEPGRDLLCSRGCHFGFVCLGKHDIRSFLAHTQHTCSL